MRITISIIIIINVIIIITNIKLATWFPVERGRAVSKMYKRSNKYHIR